MRTVLGCMSTRRRSQEREGPSTAPRPPEHVSRGANSSAARLALLRFELRLDENDRQPSWFQALSYRRHDLSGREGSTISSRKRHAHVTSGIGRREFGRWRRTGDQHWHARGHNMTDTPPSLQACLKRLSWSRTRAFSTDMNDRSRVMMSTVSGSFGRWRTFVRSMTTTLWSWRIRSCTCAAQSRSIAP